MPGRQHLQRPLPQWLGSPAQTFYSFCWLLGPHSTSVLEVIPMSRLTEGNSSAENCLEGQMSNEHVSNY